MNLSFSLFLFLSMAPFRVIPIWTSLLLVTTLHYLGHIFLSIFIFLSLQICAKCQQEKYTIFFLWLHFGFKFNLHDDISSICVCLFGGERGRLFLNSSMILRLALRPSNLEQIM